MKSGDLSEFKRRMRLCQEEGVTVDSVLRVLVREGLTRDFIKANRRMLETAEDMESEL